MSALTEQVREYRLYLSELSGISSDARYGFFGPESMAWRVNREAALGLGALRALLMQVAHPAVARGVAEHSRYRQRPYKRAYSTFRAQQAIVFGSKAEASDALARMYARHGAVRGESYRALDPNLQLWVWATLIDSALYATRQFVTTLPDEQAVLFYGEARLFGRLLGIPEEMMPGSLPRFEEWIKAKLQDGSIGVGETGREIAAALLDLPTRAARPFNRRWAATILPEPLARAYGLEDVRPFSPRVLSLVRRFVGMLPRRLRTVPAYGRAMKRVRAAAQEAGGQSG